MKILALVSQKGGAGKSLLSAHLAVAFEESGMNSVVIDLDRQGSLKQWGQSRKSDSPTVAAGSPARLAVMMDVARRADVDLVIIDTPPHSDNAALSAITLADLVLMPIRPSIFDLRAIKETVEIVAAAKKRERALIVLNAVPPQGDLADDAEAAARSYGVDVAPVRIGMRAAFAHALIGGQGITEFEPRGKAAGELRELQRIIGAKLNFSMRKQ